MVAEGNEHPDFVRAFEPGRVFFSADDHDSERRIEVVEAGRLVLRSGALEVVDPVMEEAGPVQRDVPSGTFPVLVSIRHCENLSPAVACVAVVLQEGTPVRFVPALADGQPDLPGVAVESGLAAVADAEAVDAFVEAMGDLDSFEDKDLYMELDLGSGFNGFIWDTGGDAVFPCYSGLDRTGKLCWFVWDSGLLMEEVWDQPEFDLDTILSSQARDPALSRVDLRVRGVERTRDKLVFEISGAGLHEPEIELVDPHGQRLEFGRLLRRASDELSKLVTLSMTTGIPADARVRFRLLRALRPMDSRAG